LIDIGAVVDGVDVREEDVLRVENPADEEVFALAPNCSDDGFCERGSAAKVAPRALRPRIAGPAWRASRGV
jgi:hypothetical protein